MNPLELVVSRSAGNACTLGMLFVDGAPFCHTLEDPDRFLERFPDAKIKGETAIPRGRYEVVITRSERFSRKASARAGYHVDVFMPLLKDVPGYTGVRIHSGNEADDTDGCILVGTYVDGDTIGNSRTTYQKLFDVIKEALDCNRQVFLKVI